MPMHDAAPTSASPQEELLRLRERVAVLTRERDGLLAAFQDAPIGIYQTLSDGQVLDVNMALARMLLLDSPEAVKAYHANIAEGYYVDRSRRDEFLSLLREHGAVEGFEYRARCWNGAVVWLAASARVIETLPDGRFVITGYVTDITSRKLAEQEARENAAVLRTLLDALPTPIFYKGTDGRYLGCNQAWEYFLGRSRASIVGHTVEDVFPADEAAVFRNMDTLLLENGGRQIYETRIKARQGQCQVIVSKAEFHDDQGRVAGLVGVVTDITSQKKVEARSRRALEAAEASNRAKSAFLATMSHEIRTPLNGILGMLQLLLTTGIDDEQRDYARMAMEAAEALLRILADILDISRIESGNMPLVDEVFDLAEVVRPVAAAFAHAAAGKGLAFACDIEPDMPCRLRGDAGRVRQILYNLTANAIKFTDSGQVRLHIQALAEGTDQDKVTVRFDVVDTGIGIPQEQIGRVFDAFTQVDPSMTRPYGGSGLGLSIVKGLVDRMGGRIALCSQEGRGTELHVTLCFGRPPEVVAQEDGQARETMLPLGGLRVLVAEDERINQMTIRAMLHKLGCRAALCGDGAEALTALSTEDYDVVLMDIQMPVMDGMETIRLIREGSGVRNPMVPVVALTAHAMEGDRETVLAAGMDAYISKPVEMDELARTLARMQARR